MSETDPPPSPVAFPYPHFMALAPLDAWARLLLRPPLAPAPRYWLRLAAGLGCSIVGTGLTLPERLLLAPWLAYAYQSSGGAIDHPPGALVILGYFRTGTTHLHYLLNSDPRFITPRWAQVTAPQGFHASWMFLRLFLVPFLASRRPQDDVAFGPDWPAEDDFACHNWACASSLRGRLIAPSRYDSDRRFHFLDGLTAREIERWRYVQWAFLRKVLTAGRGRMLLLKSPSHTARVPELQRLLGRERTRFIHISRDPADVVNSNVAMLRRLHLYRLEDPPDERVLRERIIEEYAQTERAYLESRPLIGPGQLHEMRYEDLRADPLGEMKRAYAALDLPWTSGAERRSARYLYSVRDYRPASESRPRGLGFGDERLEFIDEAFGHARPAVAARPAPPPAEAVESRTRRRAWIGAAVAAVALALLWHLIVRQTLNRHDWLAWPAGVLIGAAALRLARAGSARLGWWCAALTVLVALAVSMPNSRWAYYKRYDPAREQVTWTDLLATSRHEFFTGMSLFWLFMGAATAYRFGSRPPISPN